MSRFTTKEELAEDSVGARSKLDGLLATIPERAKCDEVTDGMPTRDFVAHRSEWGRMALAWHPEARASGSPAVPAEGYTWGQLKELNADIRARFADIPLDEAQRAFGSVHDQLIRAIEGCSVDELFASSTATTSPDHLTLAHTSHRLQVATTDRPTSTSTDGGVPTRTGTRSRKRDARRLATGRW